MSNNIDLSKKIYHQFQKLFNSFDIYLKYQIVQDFYDFYGQGHSALLYFNDDNKKSLSFNNQNFKNAKQITLNNYFYNMIHDDKFKKFMQKIIDDYDEKNDNKKDDDNINNNLKGYDEIKKDKENEGV